MEMNMHDEHYTLRADLVEALERDLVGPRSGPNEVLTDDPVATYICGALFPRAAGTIRRRSRTSSPTTTTRQHNADPRSASRTPATPPRSD
jgi:hypothetical protein